MMVSLAVTFLPSLTHGARRVRGENKSFYQGRLSAAARVHVVARVVKPLYKSRYDGYGTIVLSMIYRLSNVNMNFKHYIQSLSLLSRGSRG